MPAESPLPPGPHLQPQDPYIPSTKTPSQQAPSSSSARAPTPATTSTITRPQREAAMKARERLEDAYALYPFEQDPDSDSDSSSPRPSAPPPTPVRSDKSSDSDAFVDESESDCVRRSEAALRKKRKRSTSAMMIDVGERMKLKAWEALGTDDEGAREGATRYMINSGAAVKDVLLGKASRASRGFCLGPGKRVQCESWGREVRRAGLSDMGPVICSNMPGRRDEIWAEASEGSVSRRNGVRWPVDGDGYRVSRFSEHF